MSQSLQSSNQSHVQFYMTTNKVELLTDVFRISTHEPFVWQEDELVSMVAIIVPTEQVIPWLTKVTQYSFRIDTKSPYDPIVASGFLTGSRKNLIFAANHCDFR